jgi:phosphatidylglycerophosphate synthase
MALCLMALATDVADGFLARRLGVASTSGRHWDSLGDKSFYIAILVAFLAHGLILTVLAWGLLTREVALYITRILYIRKIDHVEMIRPYTNWHGYFMYAMIVLGFAQIYGTSTGREFGAYPFVQVTAMAALAFGVLSIFAYINLED